MKQVEKLTRLLGRLPGLGPRSARRVVQHLLARRESLLIPLAQEMMSIAESLTVCQICGNWDEVTPCYLCSDEKRQSATLCVVEQIADLWALERSACFNGRYHVLGGVLSALNGVGPDDLRLASLEKRVLEQKIEEVILATNLTVEGQTTAHYIADRLGKLGVKITRLARGVPIGGELDYMDEGTLITAIESRQKLS